MPDRTTAAHERVLGLTETQGDLLRSAVQEGYFRVPREITLSELAVKHDLPGREASEELWRGLDIVVRDAMSED